jgi:hypothetical protein
MHRISVIAAVAAALAVAVVGRRWGAYAAGGADSAGCVLMADAVAAGRLRPTSSLAAEVPWPDAAETFTPGGFVASEIRPAASAPVCAPGFSALLAPLIAAGGRDAVFVLTPLAGALLVWETFVVGSTIANPLAGAMAAVLVASSPAMLYQLVQPMNDVTTAALWMAAFSALIRRRWTLAGLSCGVALLVRPNLLPLACAAAVYLLWNSGVKALARFAAPAVPFGLLVLWLNNSLYGSPFRTGYGRLGHLFTLSAFEVNASRYAGWLADTHTLFPLLAFAAPFVVAREKRADTALAIGIVLATCAVYFFYTPFDEWSYLRFLLPAIGLMLVLASAVSVDLLARAVSRRPGVLAPGVVLLTAGLAVFCVRTADQLLAFDLQHLEQRYRSAGIAVRERLPERAVVLSVWDSGAVRFHGRREALSWTALEPAWLDPGLSWLEQQGRPPYILVESWEEPAFRSRFGSHSDIGKLDWPPKFEIDRVVRIFDPKDRARYHTGDPVNTEYLWPHRD